MNFSHYPLLLLLVLSIFCCFFPLSTGYFHIVFQSAVVCTCGMPLEFSIIIVIIISLWNFTSFYTSLLIFILRFYSINSYDNERVGETENKMFVYCVKEEEKKFVLLFAIYIVGLICFPFVFNSFHFCLGRWYSIIIFQCNKATWRFSLFAWNVAKQTLDIKRPLHRSDQH